jgi:hypothetical protein
LAVKGYDFDWLVCYVSKLFDLDPDLVTRRGRYPDTVEARSVLCRWAAREFGTSTIELSRRLGITQPTASQSEKRGGKTVKKGSSSCQLIYLNKPVPSPTSIYLEGVKRWLSLDALSVIKKFQIKLPVAPVVAFPSPIISPVIDRKHTQSLCANIVETPSLE